MKHKFKFISIISGLVVILSSALIAVSCSFAPTPEPQIPGQVGNSLIKNNEVTPETQYINDRTMSIRMTYKTETTDPGSSMVGWGTGWIFDKDTQLANTYYVATNMHVIDLMYEGIPNSYRYYYGVGNLGSALSDSNYIEIPSNNFHKIELGISDNSVTPDPYLIDFGLLKITFKGDNKMTTAYNNSPTMFYTAPSAGDMIYTGGFPAITNSEGSYDPNRQVGWHQYQNRIDGFEYNTIKKAKSSIVYNGEQMLSKATNGLINTLDMGGGSSGSMVIEENSDASQYYVVGIYWGGYAPVDKSSFDGAFNLINGSNKNEYNILNIWSNYIINHPSIHSFLLANLSTLEVDSLS